MQDNHSTRLYRNRVRWFIGGMAIVLMMWLPGMATASNDSCGGSAQQKSLKTSAQRTAMAVLSAIERGDVNGFVQHLSSRGVGFGVDKSPLPVGTIKRQLRLKEGVYCLLFSTPCIPTSKSGEAGKTDPVLSKWTISYQEWLRRNHPHAVDVFLLNDSPICGGLVRVHAAAEFDSVPRTLELEFNYEGGKWALVNTPDSLGE